MKKEELCGFIVVRTPETGERKILNKISIKNEVVFYRGLDRQRWEDVEHAYYLKTLHPSVQHAFKVIEENNNDFTTLKVTNDLDTAIALCDFSNKKEKHSEVIAIRSQTLSEIKGSFSAFCAVDWIGYDVFYLGGWSLVQSGIFSRPDQFTSWFEKINQYGLFDNTRDGKSYIDDYLNQSSKNIVEDIPDNPFGIDVIEVGLVNLPNVRV
jgi:hypothetical protein